MLFIEYPKCSTCKKAKNYLNIHNISYEERNIVTNNPTYNELTNWVNKYQIPINKLFNTSGLKYKELNLKEKLSSMNNEEKIKLLSTDGMLVKRPLLIAETFILIGFKEENWNSYLIK